METHDLHGLNLEESLALVERLIGKIRLQGREGMLKFITGRGAIREELMRYFRQNNIDHGFELGNDGVINATID